MVYGVQHPQTYKFFLVPNVNLGSESRMSCCSFVKFLIPRKSWRSCDPRSNQKHPGPDIPGTIWNFKTGKSNPWPCMAMGVLFFVDIIVGVKSTYCWIKNRWFCSTLIAPSITFQHYNDVSSPKSGLGLLLGSQNPNPRSWPSPKMIPLFKIQISDLLQRWSHPRSTGVCPWFCFHHL